MNPPPAPSTLTFLSSESIAALLVPYVTDAPPETDWPHIHTQLALYLDLILKWNARTNLTAIRDPEEIVCRHFGESLFAGIYLGKCQTLLDFGSGAGFPGIPIQLLRPEIAVTLAESQSKKVAFLREACRTLNLPTEIWPARVESMPPARRFDAVTLRAVDNMEAALREASVRAHTTLVILGTTTTPTLKFPKPQIFPLPKSATATLQIFSR